MKRTKIRIAGVAAAAAAVVGAGAAVAADRLSPTEESDAIVEDAAKQLGVSADKLDAALKKALANRVDAAVKAGALTEVQGEELKERIADGEVPLTGVGPGRGHFGGHGPGHLFIPSSGSLDAVADYLDLTRAELWTALREGSTLAEIAEEEGKSADGLKAALVAEVKTHLAEAVEDGRLTAAQQAEIVARLSEHVDALVEGELRLPGHGLRGFGFRFGGPPPATETTPGGEA
jgi:hypothetical protein